MDIGTETNTVAERLGMLERENRWLKGGLIAIALGMAAVVLMAAMPTTFGTVRARKFELVDATGKVRSGLSLVNNEPALALIGVGGKLRAVLLITRNGTPHFELDDLQSQSGVVISTSGISLHGPRGSVRAALTLESHGTPVFGLFGSRGIIRAGIALTKNSEPQFDLFDSRDKGGVVLGMVAPGQPQLALMDSHGKRRASLDLAKNGRPFFGLSDASGENRIVLRELNGGQPFIGLSDRKNLRLALGSSYLTSRKQGGSTITPASTITAFDKKGNVIGEWPQ